MQILQNLKNNKSALSLYRVFRKIYLPLRGHKLFILQNIDQSSRCYVKGSLMICTINQITELNVSFNELAIAVQIHPTHNFDHKFPGYFQYEVQLPVIGVQDFRLSNQFSVEVVTEAGNEIKIISLDLLCDASNEFSELKAKKLERIKSVLMCPITKEELIETKDGFESLHAGHLYPKNLNSFNFLPSEFAKSFNIISTYNISAHNNKQYEDDILAELLKKGVHEPLILDCGSGLKPTYRKEVVNFEIVDYPTTDVLGVNEKLPFKDNSFDAVFSSAVLEHVKDPFASAREISRVLKPGGILMAFVPFLQPYHGYPHHYYNMTVSGIRNLFENEIDIREVGTNLHPLDLMPWYIGRYVQSLNEKDRNTFMNLKMRDFRNTEYIASQGFYKNISKQTHEELAFVVKTSGYKKL